MPKAIRLHQTGGPEVMQWEEVEVGAPGEGQARIRHTAVGVNFVDTYQRSGLYSLPLPSGLGSEGAGVVESVGKGVTQVQPQAAMRSQHPEQLMADITNPGGPGIHLCFLSELTGNAVVA